jgi:protein-disulfide isomerase
MNRAVRELVLRAAALAGLGVSVLLITEYWQPVPVLCAPGGGCDVVRASRYSAVLGVPLPIIGVLFFAAVFGMSVSPRARRWLFPVAAAGGVAGLGLVAIQAFVVNAFCQLCLVADIAALVIAAIAFVVRTLPPSRLTGRVAIAHAAAAVAVTVGATLFAAHAGAGSTSGVLPPVVQREQRPSLATVVEFVDFECPACRAQHDQFRAVLATFPGKVHVVLKNMPLPQHQHAVDAARAFCCAEENGAAHAMADRLFGAQQLGAQDCEEMAVGLGLDRDQFRSCVASAHVTERLRADGAAAAAVGVRGLPTFWIGQERFEGVQDGAVLRASIDRALRRAAQS